MIDNIWKIGVKNKYKVIGSGDKKDDSAIENKRGIGWEKSDLKKLTSLVWGLNGCIQKMP